MKVILLRDVAKIGRRGDVTDVPDGYALNQLIPKRWAEPATSINLKRATQAKAVQAAGEHAEHAEFAAAKASLAACTPRVLAEANEKGHLFRAISVEEVSAAAAEQGITVPVSMIKLDHSIKDLGEHTLTLSYGSERASFSIEVIKK